MARDFKTKQDGISDFYGQQSIDAGASLQSIAGGYTNSVTGLANQGLVLKIASADGLQYPITFVAFMESLNDNFSQNFNQDQVFGRMDPIQSYQNTERKLSMSWKLLAANIEEAQRNMLNISQLTQLMYPKYTSSGKGGQNKIKSAPVMAIKYMNLVTDKQATGQYLFGTISSLSITPDLEFGVLQPAPVPEFAGTDPNGATHDQPGIIFPKIFTLSISFNPIHHATLGSNAMPHNHLFGVGTDFSLDTSEEGIPPVMGALPPENKYRTYVDSQQSAILSAQDDAKARHEQPWTRVSDKFKSWFKDEKKNFKP
tara:strand:+ start:74 stop:1012 length:939 start_codon:yes stop_codon:yes gene_type:complete